MSAGSWIRWWDLAVTLTLRELTVRYKRSVLGILWALAEPVLNVVVYVVVFGVFLGASSQTPNYHLYVLAGLLPWLFLSSTLEQCSSTLLEHSPLVRKIAFPHELLVLAVVASRLTTLLLGLALTLLGAGFLGLRGATIAWDRLTWLPVGLGSLVVLTAGIGLLIAALNVLFRDAGFLLRFALRLGFYACPIVYSLDRVPVEFSSFFSLNPLLGVFWCFQAFTSDGSSRIESTVLVAHALGAASLGMIGWRGFRALMPAVVDRL
ncbi:MAG: hypothetical protein FJ137_21085 [Deltaproteobacteria bacterium]|nr:hypothetical protein [Deltaproteobacteria bacterium]